MNVPGLPRAPRYPPFTGRPRDYLVIALVSATVMLFEIAVTRILSVVLWYHFAFLAASLAMLGMGAPGVWFALRGVRPRTLEWALLASAVTVPLSVVALFQYGGPLAWRAALATLCIGVPMLALGSAVCVLLLRAPGRTISRMYGADLLGATVGALAVVPLMHVVPTPAIVAGTAVLPALALGMIGRGRIGLAVLAAVALLIAWREPLRVRYGKVYAEKGVNLLYERWTPTARLTAFSRRVDQRAGFGWGMGTRYAPRAVSQLWLEQDGSAGTPITQLSDSIQSLGHLSFDVTSLGHQLRTPATVCVIGGGGGRDILTALLSGAGQVDAVELNPYVVDAVSRHFGTFSGDVYHLPGVRAIVSEGRSFLTGTPRRYDLIQISLIDSWAATAAGAYALSENYLYTLEAYRLYWNRLSPTGILSTSRWMVSLEAVRLAHLVREALAREAIAEPERHIAIAQAGSVATVLASRKPFTGALLQALDAACTERGFERRWPVPAPGAGGDIGLVLQKGPAAFRARGVEVSVPVDDRPFFFHNVAVFGTGEPEGTHSFLVNTQAVIVLRHLMVLVTALAVVLFFLPFALRGALPRAPGFWRGSFYFALIGVAFMLVEIPVIQKMILYLGHPSHAITVVLASMLLGAGLGSLASERLPIAAVPLWAGLLLLALAAANLGLHGLSVGTIGWPWPARVAIAFAIAGLLGFFMGFALPLGMLRFGDVSKAWFWAVNGACGVMASVCSLGLSMTFGFERVIWIGFALYGVAVLMLDPYFSIFKTTRVSGVFARATRRTWSTLRPSRKSSSE